MLDIKLNYRRHYVQIKINLCINWHFLISLQITTAQEITNGFTIIEYSKNMDDEKELTTKTLRTQSFTKDIQQVLYFICDAKLVNKYLLSFNAYINK